MFLNPLFFKKRSSKLWGNLHHMPTFPYSGDNEYHWLKQTDVAGPSLVPRCPHLALNPCQTLSTVLLPGSKRPSKTGSLRTRSDKPRENGLSELASCKCWKVWLVNINNYNPHCLDKTTGKTSLVPRISARNLK